MVLQFLYFGGKHVLLSLLYISSLSSFACSEAVSLLFLAQSMSSSPCSKCAFLFLFKAMRSSLRLFDFLSLSLQPHLLFQHLEETHQTLENLLGILLDNLTPSSKISQLNLLLLQLDNFPFKTVCHDISLDNHISLLS